MKFFLLLCYTFLTLQFLDRASVIAAIITIRLLVFLVALGSIVSPFLEVVQRSAPSGISYKVCT